MRPLQTCRKRWRFNFNGLVGAGHAPPAAIRGRSFTGKVPGRACPTPTPQGRIPYPPAGSTPPQTPRVDDEHRPLRRRGGFHIRPQGQRRRRLPGSSGTPTPTAQGRIPYPPGRLAVAAGVRGRPMVAPTRAIRQECNFLTVRTAAPQGGFLIRQFAARQAKRKEPPEGDSER